MPISPAEAESTLIDISATGRASKTFYGYRMASPHMILWGVIWALGYGLSYSFPRETLVWPVLDVIGMTGSFWIGFRNKGSAKFPGAWRYGATALAIFLFIVALFAVIPPRSAEQLSAFFPIFVSLLYALFGIWSGGTRLIIAGSIIAALTLGGFFWLPHIFTLWMAVVGGGALILGGLWLRKM
jgi:hypothetical protein